MESANHEEQTVFLINSSESVDLERQLYALFYVILYKGFEQLQILVSGGHTGTNLP